MLVENGNLEDVINADGVVVKDEKVYNASVGGSVTYYCEDGEKVKAGQLVADLNTDTSSAGINKQMAEIQKVIDQKYDSNNSKVSAVVLSRDSLASFENEVQVSILNNDLNGVYSIVGQVGNNSSMTINEDK